LRLPAENLLLGERRLKKLLSAFNTQRFSIPDSLGLAECLDEALRYARGVAFGKSPSAIPGMRC